MDYTLAQMNPMTGDIEGNRKQIEETIQEADSDVVVFPEMALPGYCVGDRVENDQFVEENLDALERIAEETDDTAAVVGYLDADGEERYNAAAVLHDGEVQGTVYKRLLPNYRYFDDERYFEAGEEAGVVSLMLDDEELDLGVSICEDMWDEEYEESPIADLAAAGADIVININASPFEPGKREQRDAIIREHVEETGLSFLYVNTVGAADVGKNVLAFDGESRVYSGEGELVAVADRFEETAVTVDPVEADIVEPEDASREESIYEALTMALRDYMDKNGFE
ncbi:MAG: nitrilase-related carbon-nitrogen hydrolase, partial [Candidatus Nanohaloarchaea archaeon]|nr:nitrilase-related carbon-nitrogen hydrolase [Candidatus Nanohaloarchaea archaeon]